MVRAVRHIDDEARGDRQIGGPLVLLHDGEPFDPSGVLMPSVVPVRYGRRQVSIVVGSEAGTT